MTEIFEHPHHGQEQAASPAERLIASLDTGKNQASPGDDHVSFTEVLANIRAKQTEAERFYFAMQPSVHDVPGAGQEWETFGDLAKGREACARDPDFGYPIPSMSARAAKREATRPAVVAPVEPVSLTPERMPISNLGEFCAYPRAAESNGHGHSAHQALVTLIDSKNERWNATPVMA